MLKALRNNIIITPKHENEVTNSTIFIRDTRDKKSNWFTVLAVGEQCRYVKKGDVILLNYGDHTPPIYMNNTLMAVSDESKVICVAEEEKVEC